MPTVKPHLTLAQAATHQTARKARREERANVGGMTPRVPGWTDKQLEEFRANVRLLRDRLAPAYLKSRLGITAQAMRYWESGDRAPTAENMQAVSDLARVAKKLPD